MQNNRLDCGVNNMRENIIVFGIGNDWEINKELIKKNFNIIAYCDNDNTKSVNNLKKICDLNELRNLNNRILITSSKYKREITENLTRIGITEERLIFLSELEMTKIYWGTNPIKGVSYSGSSEDLLIGMLLDKLAIDYSEVRYIELGVMDPIISSNTYYFYTRGAQGILVEANPMLIPRIKRVRPRDIIINKAIYDVDNAKIPFWVSNEPGLSSIYKDHIKEEKTWEKLGIKKEIQVQTITMKAVFEKINKVDLLSIDLEGYDYSALLQLDMKKYRPKLIIAELNWLHISGRKNYQNIVDLLCSNDYKLYFQNEYNGIFIDSTLM